MFVFVLACFLEQPPVPIPVDAQDPSQNAGEPGVGLWNRARLDEEIAALEAIGYVGGEHTGGTRTGVVLNQPGAWDGVSFYVSGHAPEATLMDRDGTVLHRWHMPFKDAFPTKNIRKGAHGPEFFRRATLLPDGAILAIYEGHGLVKLDRDSNLVWAWPGKAHHDLEVLPDGRIWVLSRSATVRRDFGDRPILEDEAVLLSQDGDVLKRVSVLDAVVDSAPDVLAYLPRRSGDVFHTNAIRVLTGPHPVFGRDHLLLSLRIPSVLLVLNPDKGDVVWHHRGDVRHQHDPVMTSPNRMLVFDNDGGPGGTSRVVEYETPAMKEVWSYVGTDTQPFYSKYCGAAQRLPNGNTLITESGLGRVFEVTRDLEVVWTFHNPARAGDEGEFVAIVPELKRLPRSAASFLAKPR